LWLEQLRQRSDGLRGRCVLRDLPLRASVQRVDGSGDLFRVPAADRGPSLPREYLRERSRWVRRDRLMRHVHGPGHLQRRGRRPGHMWMRAEDLFRGLRDPAGSSLCLRLRIGRLRRNRGLRNVSGRESMLPDARGSGVLRGVQPAHVRHAKLRCHFRRHLSGHHHQLRDLSHRPSLQQRNVPVTELPGPINSASR
jgi:hypothetical protein